MINILIFASDEDDNIGFENGLPWERSKSDLHIFKEVTSGHSVTMGRNTFRSLGMKPLENRINNIVTRKITLKDRLKSLFYNAICSDTKLYFQTENDPNKFKGHQSYCNYIMGGAQIYKSFEKYCDEVTHTRINGKHKGDTKFRFNQNDFNLICKNAYKEFTITNYERKL